MSKIKQFKKLSKAVLCTAVALGISSNAFAQKGIEEVVVTATKRSSTLQEIPIAVSVVGSDVIDKANILDLKDLQTLVPSLRINQLQNSTNTNFIIRGFGNGANNPGIEPSVAIFIDGVYRSRSASQIGDLPNLERVEVLRGPQSTLFGKNASAGVISVVTKKPTGEAGGKVSATLGNESQMIVKAQVEGALTEKIAFDLSGNLNQRDGYFKNLTTGNELNNRDREAVRAQLFITPNDDTEVRVIADYDSIDEECCGVNNLFQSPTEMAINNITQAQVVANNPHGTEGYFSIDPTNQITNYGLSAQVDHDFGSMALTSITSKRKSDSFSNIDADFTSADLITNPIASQISTFTQELRLASTGENVIDWMVGVFYFDESIDHTNELDYGPGFRPWADAQTALVKAPNALAGVEMAFGIPLGTFFGENGSVKEHGTLDNEATSLFGQFDFHISDSLTATVGLNYTEDEKQSSLKQDPKDVISGLDFVAAGFAGAFSAITSLPATAENISNPALAAAVAASSAVSTTLCAADGSNVGACNTLLGLGAFQFLKPLQAYPNNFEDGRSNDSQVTYTARLNYAINDNLSVYGGYSTGFKASSWNLSRDAKPTADDITKLRGAGLAENNLEAGTRFAYPEEAAVIEFGVKTRFDIGTFNLTIFDQQIEGFQSNVFQGSGFNLANAEKQSTQGVEFDLTLYPTDGLRLTLAGTLLDPIYDVFENAAVDDNNDPVNYNGQPVAGVHETSLSFAGSYTFNVGSLEAYVGGDFLYEDQVKTNDNVPEAYSSEESKTLNMNAGIKTEDGLSLSVWSRNLTDHETTTTGFPSVGNTKGYYGYRNVPRSFGVTLAKEF